MKDKPLVYFHNTAFIVLLFTFLLSASACTSLLKANFNDDTVGSLPDKSLPGNPSGDEIRYAAALEPRLEVVTHPDFSTHVLAHEFASIGTGVPSRERWLSFRAKSTNLTRPVTFTWSGMADFSYGNYFTVYLEDGSGGLFAMIRIESDGDVLLADNFSSFSEVGTITSGQKHTFIVTVDVGNETYNFSVFQPGQNITVESHPLLLEDNLLYANPANPLASFQFQDGAGAMTYFMDEIFISKGD